MNIFSRIGHSGRHGYRSAQWLLAASGAAALVSLWAAPSLQSTAGIAAAAGIVLVACLSALLAHIRGSLLVTLRDATRAQETQLHSIRTDPLTGALSRRYFLDELAAALGSPLNPGKVTLVLVDLDHFKQLNDSFGHPFGDTVLTYLVAAMRQYFPGAVIGRLGGDEFALLLTEDRSGMLSERARRLQVVLEEGLLHEGSHIALSASLGAAVSPGHASQPKDLMVLADLALYDSKAAGRGRLTVFKPDILSDKRHQRYIERELRAAIYLDELELHYQPVVEADGTMLGLEALVRWRHPVRGLVSPGEFVPVAERSNLIDVLGAWVFRTACLDAGHFPGKRISVNVSGQQLRSDQIIAMLKRTMKETGREASNFVLEITETTATSATPEVVARLSALREMGFRIALDDFGTGHCGFNYVKTLPIDSIKIDRSYIQSIGHDDVARVFVSAVCEIARLQDLSIVAEGIETEAELMLARAAGCTRFQGYFFAKPAAKTTFALVQVAARDLRDARCA